MLDILHIIKLKRSRTAALKYIYNMCASTYLTKLSRSSFNFPVVYYIIVLYPITFELSNLFHTSVRELSPGR